MASRYIDGRPRDAPQPERDIAQEASQYDAHLILCARPMDLQVIPRRDDLVVLHALGKKDVS